MTRRHRLEWLLLAVTVVVAGASALSRPLRVDPAAWPWLRWRWKIDNLVAAPAHQERQRLPGAAVRDVRLPAGQVIVPRAHQTAAGPGAVRSRSAGRNDPLCVGRQGGRRDHRRQRVYQPRQNDCRRVSGAAHVKRWVDVERNVAADFRAAFGEEPPQVSAIAVGTDPDNTGSFATAYFGDIVFYKQQLAK